MKLIDISPVIDPSIAVWPGDTPFARTVNVDMSAGGNYNLSDIRTTLHVGAHTDATSHYVPGGEDIASRPLDYYIGPCNVVAVKVVSGESIGVDDIAQKEIDTPRVLFRTGTFPDPAKWNEDFASFTPELIDLLHDLGVVLVGIDTPSVDPFASKTLDAHQALARHRMANLEGLILDGVSEGRYELIALPLRIRGGDASPVRAVLRLLE